MELIQTSNDFDNLLAQVIEETAKYCLGDINANIIFKYLKERNLPLCEVSNNPEMFSEELRKILGFGRGQILCAASIIEETILELLCKKLQIKPDYQTPVNFPIQLKKIREPYVNGGNWR